jgi:hypothetical protein
MASEGRLVFGDAVTPSAAIPAAVAAIDPPAAWKPSSPYVSRPAEVPNAWTGYFQALLEVLESEIDPASDSVEAEAP